MCSFKFKNVSWLDSYIMLRVCACVRVRVYGPYGHTPQILKSMRIWLSADTGYMCVCFVVSIKMYHSFTGHLRTLQTFCFIAVDNCHPAILPDIEHSIGRIQNHYKMHNTKWLKVQLNYVVIKFMLWNNLNVLYLLFEAFFFNQTIYIII
jgi:hypothetical protein